MPTSLGEFRTAYDAMLARWPVPVEVLEIPTAYGITRVNACGPIPAPIPIPPDATPTDATPIVLLHGGRTNSTYWFNNVAALSARRRVYAVDTMGDPGLSNNTGIPLRSRDDVFTWLDEVLEAISGLGGAERTVPVDLCGHSFGAWTALAYALRSPRRVRRIALLDPTQCFAGFSPACLFHAAPGLLARRAQTAQAAQARYLAWESAKVPRNPSPDLPPDPSLDPQWLAMQGLASTVPTAKLIGGRRPKPAEFQSLADHRTAVLVVLAQNSRVHDIRKVEANARRVLPPATAPAPARIEVLPGVSHHTMPFARAGQLNGLLAAHF